MATAREAAVEASISWVCPEQSTHDASTVRIFMRIMVRMMNTWLGCTKQSNLTGLMRSEAKAQDVHCPQSDLYKLYKLFCWNLKVHSGKGGRVNADEGW